MKRTNYTIANWKMNGSKASKKLVKSIINHIRKSNHKKSKVIICPPFTLLSELKSIDKKLLIGAQDCHQFEKGAYTGSISSQMLRDIGCKYVILGSGNCPLWIIFYRGNVVNVYQQLKNTWIIH